MIDDIKLQQIRTGLKTSRLPKGYGLSRSTWYGWLGRGRNRITTRPGVTSILPVEESAVVAFRAEHREVGYRKLTWMMNYARVAALSEAAVYQVLERPRPTGTGNAQSL